ncbi:DUF1329 domain-containing protein [Marinobacter pelagius]|uniref:DUF1329 domain-containing protein n=1 Tax=Marinobacter sp. C7 TaxID=2951363 RepID=UPI001EF05304|nr:DUF1329 domain-containing protein [Marinobacter sp. C7]MCG7201498.1 DUF1329 domain-containing protein [Marinobacter sp. C7]
MFSKISKKLAKTAVISVALSVCFTASANDDVTRLGAELTPLGGLKAGNPEGTIPEWKGGLPIDAGKVVDGFMSNPFEGEEPKFVINSENYKEYENKLSEGQVAMLTKYPESYKIPVYESRRTANVPQEIEAAAKRSVKGVETVNDGNGLKGLSNSRYYAFPLPDKGVEVIWNHMTRYRGGSMKRTMVQVSPYANGDYSLVRFDDIFSFPETVDGATDEHMESVLFFYLQRVLSPSRLSGSVLMAHETVDQVKDPRRVWVYNSGQRRVRRAPQVAYDGPGQAADGQRVADNLDMYNGAPDRYDWELVGKKEMYIPYNNYELGSPNHKYKDIFKAGHINQDLTRYELHRVWEVKATLKDGDRHVYAERTFYLDEDTWQIVLQDMYDGRGNLWRVAEGHAVQFYHAQVPGYAGEVLYDLLNGRYLAMGFTNEEAHGPTFGTETELRDFSPSALRQAGR